MKPENREFLDSIYHWWTYYQQSGSMRDASVIHPERLQQVMRDEWEPRYVACLTCPESIRELFTKVFQLYDKQKNIEANESRLQATNPNAGDATDEEGEHHTPNRIDRPRGRPRKR